MLIKSMDGILPSYTQVIAIIGQFANMLMCGFGLQNIRNPTFNCHTPKNLFLSFVASFHVRLIGAGDTRFLNSSCAVGCQCNSTLFEPVCGADDLTYFSPCRASCHKALIDGVSV